MKIGVIGAPGAGKSKFARKLAYGLGQHVFDKPPTVIDDYVPKLEKQTGYAYSYFATYAQNYQILFHRWTLEQAAEAKGHNIITCGTMYETICYAAIKANEASMNQDDMDEFVRARTAMTALGMLETVIFDYDILLYLPYDGKTLLDKGRSYDTVIDRKVPEILEGHFKSALPLRGTDRENVKYATEVVRAIRDQAETSEADESAVRGSGDVAPEEPAGE
jgi:deoxyadenosine/deoxycytidine kinase